MSKPIIRSVEFLLEAPLRAVTGVRPVGHRNRWQDLRTDALAIAALSLLGFTYLQKELATLPVVGPLLTRSCLQHVAVCAAGVAVIANSAEENTALDGLRSTACTATLLFGACRLLQHQGWVDQAAGFSKLLEPLKVLKESRADLIVLRGLQASAVIGGGLHVVSLVRPQYGQQYESLPYVPALNSLLSVFHRAGSRRVSDRNSCQAWDWTRYDALLALGAAAVVQWKFTHLIPANLQNYRPALAVMGVAALTAIGAEYRSWRVHDTRQPPQYAPLLSTLTSAFYTWTRPRAPLNMGGYLKASMRKDLVAGILAVGLCLWVRGIHPDVRHYVNRVKSVVGM